jgi:hypothetical protein
MKLIYTVLVPLSIFLSCNTSKEVSNSVASPDGKAQIDNPMAEKNEESAPSQEFTILLQEAYGGLEKSEERLITNENELKEIYGIINRFRRPGIPVPKVDFKSHIVVALFMGEKVTGGFSTEVDSVSIENDNMVVHIKENAPKSTDIVTMAICQPFCFVLIPKPEEGKRVVFNKIQ